MLFFQRQNKGQFFQEALNDVIATTPLANHLSVLSLHLKKGTTTHSYQEILIAKIRNNDSAEDVEKLFQESFFK